MPSFRRLSLTLLATALLVPAAAGAHSGGEPILIVPLDHVTAGQSFPVAAADLGPDANVSFTLARDEETVELGDRTAGPDGHFETTLTLPAVVPDGYAQLIAKSSDGSEAATWILVGERTASTPPPPGESVWWKDPTVILFLLVLVGGAAAALVLVLRRSARR